MSRIKQLVESNGIRMTVVNKMVIGFISLTLILLITSSLSFIGLQDIKHIAEVVANEKMPLQQRVASTKDKVLSLSLLSTNAFYEQDPSNLERQFSQYQTLRSSLKDSLATIVELDNNNAELLKLKDSSEQFFKINDGLFTAKQKLIDLENKLESQLIEAQRKTDEASALMLDLSYLDSKAKDMDALVGMSTNIDNKLGQILLNLDTIKRDKDRQTIDNTIETIEYLMSNVQVDVDYAKQIAVDIDDQGIFGLFDEQYKDLQLLLNKDKGVFISKRTTLDVLSQLESLRRDKTNTSDLTIDTLTKMSLDANNDAIASQEDILSAVQSNVLKSVIASILGTLATITLAIVATRNIAKPLKYINLKLNKLSKGDLTQSLKSDANDEFSDLSKNVNYLINSLRSLIGSINDKERELRDLTESTIEVGDKSLHQVALQQSQIDETSKNTQLVKQTSKSNMQQISEVDTKIVDAIKQSERVVGLVHQSASQINEQSNQAKSSAQIINRLGENSHQIGNILNVIKNIAEQTNLLALNAAIEAARAGEQGRGFAVVADEVRTLATRTQHSTEEIEKMITNLQADSSAAVSAMNEGVAEVKKGVSLIDQVTQEVNHIKQIIESIAQVNTIIVNDTKAQDHLLDDVVRSLEQIVQLSRESAKSTQQSNDATHQIATQMKELSRACDKFKLA